MLIAPALGQSLIIATCFLNKNYMKSIKEEIKIFVCKMRNQSE